MKISQYLSVIMSISALWLLLDVRSSARGLSLNLSLINSHRVTTSLHRQPQLAQNLASATTNIDANKDLKIQYVTVTRNSSDKSLLTVTGSISNHSEQPHYVYYIVAKFISKDISIKQAIIPVNIDIEPGKSKPFTHEISTDSIDAIAPETVKPVVVKYEYR
jgi:diacylglycerol kinase family enzyme